MNIENFTLQDLAQAYQGLQQQFANAQSQIATLQNELNGTRNELTNTQATLQQQTGASSWQNIPKPKRPDPFKGKGSVESWITHVTNYVSGIPGEQALAIAVSYLEGPAHEWWIGYQQTEDGQQVQTFDQLKPAISTRFESLNKVKVARDKLAKWKQIKDVSSFNDDFQRIILDIPNISIEEQIDRYTRGLKAYIWKELCTKEYRTLSDAMRDAERVESAHRRLGKPPKPSKDVNDSPTPTPMDIGNIELKKLTPAERAQCRKEGRCFRCRQKGHLASKCPKGQGN